MNYGGEALYVQMVRCGVDLVYVENYFVIVDAFDYIVATKLNNYLHDQTFFSKELPLR